MSRVDRPLRPLRPLRLGTRQSPLALAQSGAVARALAARHPGLEVELVHVVTAGDRTSGPLAALGGKGLFTRELEEGLLAGTLDLAVHSLKDLPVSLPAGLAVAAYPARADPRDVLISEVAEDLDGLPAGSTVLTGALRRQAQILLRRPDLEVVPIRGNVDTRLTKWRQSGAAAVVLAAAGLARLGLTDLPAHPLDPEIVLPAPGQGTLALETLAGGAAREICAALDDAATARAAAVERAVVAAFGGDCTLPLAVWARPAGEGARLAVTALLATPDGRHWARGEALGEDADAVTADCVEALRHTGAAEVLARIGMLKSGEPLGLGRPQENPG